MASVVRRAWNRFQPLPRPRYRAGTPKVHDEDAPANVFQVPSPSTFEAAATSREARQFVIDVLGRLTPSEEIQGQRDFFCLCDAQFGPYWRFADLTTSLWAAATLIRPNSYLEIGVRTGRSAAVVAGLRPAVDIYGFDIWAEGYADVANPGTDFVRNELARLGHTGTLELVSGDSKATVPAWLAEHPDLYFDLITVDGDHSVAGAARDLANVLPRLKVAGIVLFDDINSARPLRRVWDRLVRFDSRFATWAFTDGGYGVAAGIRVSDAPLLDTLRRLRV